MNIFFRAIEQISGIPVAKQQLLLLEVRENHKKLESCKLHDFQGPVETIGVGHSVNQKFFCSNCGGSVGFREYHWYKLGLQHANTAREKGEKA